MNAVFVESYDGFMACGPADNMQWTPLLDKNIFRIITSIPGNNVCVCSRHTYGLLPQKMKADKARKFIVAERVGKNSLRNLNRLYPNAWLIGGPAFLSAASDLSLISSLVITTVNVTLNKENNIDKKYMNPFMELLPSPSSEINFKEVDMVVRIYNMNGAKQKS